MTARALFPATVRVVIGFLLLGVFGSVAVCAGSAELPVTLRVKVEKALAIRNPDERLNALTRVGPDLGLGDIPAALQSAARMPELRNRVLFTQAILRRWSALAPAEAFGHVSQLPDGVIKRDALRVAAVNFAESDPAAAAAAAVAMSAGAFKTDAVSLVAEVWAKKDLQRALAWAEQLSEPALRDAALHAVRFVWVHAEPVSAIPYVSALPAGDVKNALLMNIASAWAARDPLAAWRWTEDASNDGPRDLLRGNVVEAWGDFAPRAAAEFASTQLEGPARERLVLLALGRWATQDPQAAMAWVFARPAGTSPARAPGEIMKIWAAAFPVEAASWIEKLRDDLHREVASHSYIDAACEWNPATSIRLAARLKNPADRQQRVRQCLKNWLPLDPELARKWIEQSDFSDGEKSAWRSGDLAE